MTVTPFHSPVLVKRRLTPPKPAIALRIASSDTPSSRATAIAERNLELRSAPHRGQVDEAHIGLRILAIGDDAPVLDLADESLHHGMIDAHHGEAIERQVLDEMAERVLHRFEGLEV